MSSKETARDRSRTGLAPSLPETLGREREQSSWGHSQGEGVSVVKASLRMTLSGPYPGLH